MSNLVIVAIPDENDRVWKVSSEKIPHLTLLFLGDSDQVANADQITQFVEHAATMTLGRFYLPVDRRGELGEDKADVLFFKKGRYDYKAIRDFRVQLLKDSNIRTAYDSTEQHDGPWLPHLTLGYPTAPAKPQDADHDYPFYDIQFNKIAVWIDDYDGPEFLLKDPWDEWETMETAPMDVAMSDISQAGAEFMLEHHGVKGMRWGVRNDRQGRDRFDPEGHSVGGDIARAVGGGLVPVLGYGLMVPPVIRLAKRYNTAATANKNQKDDKKFEEIAKSQKGFVAIHNGASAKINRDLEGINKKYTDADLAVPAKKKQYDAEVLKSMQAAYRDSANSIGNKRGDKHLDVEFRNDGTEFAIKVKEGQQKLTVAEHAALADDGTVTFTGKVKRDAAGHVQAFEFEDFDSETPDSLAQMIMSEGAEYLVHTGIMTPDYFLEHYGVKGMQWGVRRQPPSAVDAMGTSRVRAGNRRKTKIDITGGQNQDAHPDAIKVAEARAKLRKSGVVALSNGELQGVAKRLQLETQVAQLTSNRGQKFIQRQLEQQGQQTVQTGFRTAAKSPSAKKIVKKGLKTAGRAAATGAVGIALL